jgi:hypothetical protein
MRGKPLPFVYILLQLQYSIYSLTVTALISSKVEQVFMFFLSETLGTFTLQSYFSLRLNVLPLVLNILHGCLDGSEFQRSQLQCIDEAGLFFFSCDLGFAPNPLCFCISISMHWYPISC